VNFYFDRENDEKTVICDIPLIGFFTLERAKGVRLHDFIPSQMLA